MKTHLQNNIHLQKPDIKPEEMIVLENIEVKKNKHNQWIIHFKTKNHKYLIVEDKGSSSHVNGEYCEHGMATVFEIQTPDTWYAPKDGVGDLIGPLILMNFI